MKTKLFLSGFGGNFGTLRLNERSFFHALIKFTPGLKYKPTNAIHADSPGVNTSDKILNLSTIDETLLKCDVIDESVVNGVRQKILFSFTLDKPSGYKIFSEPETIHYKKVNKSILNKKTVCLEDDIHKEVDFNAEVLTFTLQLIKV